jgi:hypothetical protein
MNQEIASKTPAIIDNTKKINTLIAVGVFGGMMLVGAINFVVDGRIKNYFTQIQEYQGLIQARIATTNLQAKAGSKLPELTVVSEAFPDESSIIEVMQHLEVLVHQFDPEGSVKFLPQGPQKINNQLGVNLVVKMTITPAELITFFRQLERLPHIIEVTAAELRIPNGISNKAETNIGMTLYVQDPFTQPN